MAKVAKETGREGIDRWTSNGYGLSVSENTKEQDEAVKKINEELRNYIHKGEK